MLVIGRYLNESVVCQLDGKSGPIEIRIVFCDTRQGTNQIRLGIEAPREVKVVREELLKPNEGGIDVYA